MKKKKLLATLAVAATLCVGGVMLTSCGPDDTSVNSTDTSTSTSTGPSADTSVSTSTSASTPAHEHKFTSEWKKDETNHWHECADDGAKAEVAAHDFATWDIVYPPSETATGTAKSVCSVCGQEGRLTLPKIDATNYDSEVSATNSRVVTYTLKSNNKIKITVVKDVELTAQRASEGSGTNKFVAEAGDNKCSYVVTTSQAVLYISNATAGVKVDISVAGQKYTIDGVGQQTIKMGTLSIGTMVEVNVVAEKQTSVELSLTYKSNEDLSVSIKPNSEDSAYVKFPEGFDYVYMNYTAEKDGLLSVSFAEDSDTNVALVEVKSGEKHLHLTTHASATIDHQLVFPVHAGDKVSLLASANVTLNTQTGNASTASAKATEFYFEYLTAIADEKGENKLPDSEYKYVEGSTEKSKFDSVEIKNGELYVNGAVVASGVYYDFETSRRGEHRVYFSVPTEYKNQEGEYEYTYFTDYYAVVDSSYKETEKSDPVTLLSVYNMDGVLLGNYVQYRGINVGENELGQLAEGVYTYKLPVPASGAYMVSVKNNNKTYAHQTEVLELATMSVSKHLYVAEGAGEIEVKINVPGYYVNNEEDPSFTLTVTKFDGAGAALSGSGTTADPFVLDKTDVWYAVSGSYNTYAYTAKKDGVVCFLLTEDGSSPKEYGLSANWDAEGMYSQVAYYSNTGKTVQVTMLAGTTIYLNNNSASGAAIRVMEIEGTYNIYNNNSTVALRAGAMYQFVSGVAQKLSVSGEGVHAYINGAASGIADLSEISLNANQILVLYAYNDTEVTIKPWVAPVVDEEEKEEEQGQEEITGPTGKSADATPTYDPTTGAGNATIGNPQNYTSGNVYVSNTGADKYVKYTVKEGQETITITFKRYSTNSRNNKGTYDIYVGNSIVSGEIATNVTTNVLVSLAVEPGSTIYIRLGKNTQISKIDNAAEGAELTEIPEFKPVVSVKDSDKTVAGAGSIFVPYAVSDGVDYVVAEGVNTAQSFKYVTTAEGVLKLDVVAAEGADVKVMAYKNGAHTTAATEDITKNLYVSAGETIYFTIDGACSFKLTEGKAPVYITDAEGKEIEGLTGMGISKAPYALSTGVNYKNTGKDVYCTYTATRNGNLKLTIDGEATASLEALMGEGMIVSEGQVINFTLSDACAFNLSIGDFIQHVKVKDEIVTLTGAGNNVFPYGGIIKDTAYTATKDGLVFSYTVVTDGNVRLVGEDLNVSLATFATDGIASVAGDVITFTLNQSATFTIVEEAYAQYVEGLKLEGAGAQRVPYIVDGKTSYTTTRNNLYFAYTVTSDCAMKVVLADGSTAVVTAYGTTANKPVIGTGLTGNGVAVAKGQTVYFSVSEATTFTIVEGKIVNTTYYFASAQKDRAIEPGVTYIYRATEKLTLSFTGENLTVKTGYSQTSVKEVADISSFTVSAGDYVVISASEATKFTMTTAYPAGSEKNPIIVELGKEYTSENVTANYGQIYKYTVGADINVLCIDMTQYSGPFTVTSESGLNVTVEGGYAYNFAVTPGDKLTINSYVDNKFSVKTGKLVELTTGDNVLTGASTSKSNYSFKADKVATYKISAEGGKVFSSATSESGSASTTITVEAGKTYTVWFAATEGAEKVVINIDTLKMNVGDNDVELSHMYITPPGGWLGSWVAGKAAYTFTAPEATTYSFTSNEKGVYFVDLGKNAVVEGEGNVTTFTVALEKGEVFSFAVTSAADKYTEGLSADWTVRILSVEKCVTIKDANAVEPDPEQPGEKEDEIDTSVNHNGVAEGYSEVTIKDSFWGEETLTFKGEANTAYKFTAMDNVSIVVGPTGDSEYLQTYTFTTDANGNFKYTVAATNIMNLTVKYAIVKVKVDPDAPVVHDGTTEGYSEVAVSDNFFGKTVNFKGEANTTYKITVADDNSYIYDDSFEMVKEYTFKTNAEGTATYTLTYASGLGNVTVKFNIEKVGGGDTGEKEDEIDTSVNHNGVSEGYSEVTIKDSFWGEEKLTFKGDANTSYKFSAMENVFIVVGATGDSEYLTEYTFTTDANGEYKYTVSAANIMNLTVKFNIAKVAAPVVDPDAPVVHNGTEAGYSEVVVGDNFFGKTVNFKGEAGATYKITAADDNSFIYNAAFEMVKELTFTTDAEGNASYTLTYGAGLGNVTVKINIVKVEIDPKA